MTETPFLPSYDDIADVLIAAKSTFHPAEVHGLICGYISATSGKMNNPLDKLVLGKNKNQAAGELLQQLYEITYHQLSEFSFEFALLLPDDDSGISSRTEALGLWCQGFLTGLQQAGVPVQNREESELTDTINDIVEIAQVNYDDIPDDEEDETAWFELVEYVRLGALMIFQELKNANPHNASNESDMLH